MEGIMLLGNTNVIDIDVTNAKKGDKEAFGKLILANKLSMYRIAKSIVKNEHDVEDAMGNAILKAYTNIVKLRKNECFKPWLFKILIHECYAVIKVRKREITSDAVETFESTYEDKYKNFELMRAIDSLVENQRIPTLLFYYEDMGIKEIAKTLDVSEGTIKSRLSRAKEKLKSLIDNETRRDD